ncbi:MAG: histidine kinase [Phaeodactylibacter sp.]|uniref:histidine kinase n=1 Tax=Phaeodactylibacter sp. TaxID=1940289 RepID=UPI0032EAF89A
MFIEASEQRVVNLQQLENKLSMQPDPKQRLILLDKLIAHYVFSNIEQAEKLLKELYEILQSIETPDLLLNYHLYEATIKNQMYDYEQAEFHYQSAMAILEERGSLNQQTEAYIDYAGLCINTGDLSRAHDYLIKAGKLLKTFPSERLKARLICRDGFLQLHYVNYSKAIELLLLADKMITTLQSPLELKDYYFLTLIHSGLGQIYEVNDEAEKSIRARRKVVDMCEQMGIRTRLSWHYLSVGSSYMAQGEQENAEDFFRLAIENADDTSEDARASAYANLGFCYIERDQYEEALDLLDRADQIYSKKPEQNYNNFSNVALWRGEVFQKLNDTERALEQLEIALHYAEKQGDFKQIAGICKELATFHAELAHYEPAYLYQCKHDEYQERYNNDVDQRKQREVEAKYEAEKKSQETELLELKATRLQLKALRAQMNPHFMYNALNSIQNYITSHDVDSATKYLAKFAQLMRRSLEYSELEVISLEEEIEFLEQYLVINEKLRFENKLSYEIIIDEEIEEDIFCVPTMIIQPYVENAIEHGLRTRDNGLIKVFFFLFDEQTILCRIEDNGIGRDKALQLQMNDPQYQNHRSRGTSITEKRLSILHSGNSKKEDIYVHTEDLKDPVTGHPLGTRVEIKIPVLEIKVSPSSQTTSPL